MRPDRQKRFETLVALNLEGISTARDDGALFRLLKNNPALGESFLQARETHYLLKSHFEAARTEEGFVNGVINALNPHRLNDEAFAAAVLGRLKGKAPEKTKWLTRHPIWRIAASIVVLFGCAMGMVYHLHQPGLHYPGMARNIHGPLAWHYAPQTKQVETILAFHDTQAVDRHGGYPSDSGPVPESVRQLNAGMGRIEKSWPGSESTHLTDTKGEK